MTLCDGDTLTEHDLPAHVVPPQQPHAAPEPKPEREPTPAPLLADGLSLDDQLAAYEKEMLLTALDRAGGVRKRAAELLGIKYRSLRHRLSKYGLGDDDDSELGQAARD